MIALRQHQLNPPTVTETSTWTARDGSEIFCYRWLPAGEDVRAIVHIAHGMGEHAGRYEAVGERLRQSGYAVFAADHRGHGKTADVLGDMGHDGWNRTLEDLHGMMDTWRQQFPGKPVVLLGHSMGAMLTQHYLTRWPDTLDAAVLSGSPGFSGPLRGWLVRLITRIERWRHGPSSQSALLQRLIFGAANEPFKGEVTDPTGFEWLSRDCDAVRRYARDPLCGFVPCTGSLLDIFVGARQSERSDAIANVPAGFPLFVFSGTEDPVHDEFRNIDRMLAKYQAQGVLVETRFHDGARHEMLNETNRDEVMEDLALWLERTTAGD